jgi:hypothetical protein
MNIKAIPPWVGEKAYGNRKETKDYFEKERIEAK